jgi:hypothetical protein
VKVTFVDGYPWSTTRAPIYNGWIDQREAISELVAIRRQWLNGSFTTSKMDPGDADTVTFLDGKPPP